VAMTGRVYNWVTSNSTIATVSTAGVVTGVAVGSTSISATTGGKAGQVSVSVLAIGTVTRVEVTPGRVYLLPGESRTLSVTAYDANGFVVPGRPVSWSSADATIAAIVGTGEVRAQQLGTATVTATVDGRSGLTEIRVVPTYGQQVVSVRTSATSNNTCALTVGAAAYCWGSNAYGQVGDGTTDSRPTPTRVAGGVAFSLVVPGRDHTCGLSTAGIAYCWGDNAYGELGDGSTTSRLTPAPVAGGRSYSLLSVGPEHTCALDLSEQVWCWGRNRDGQLGAGSGTTLSTVPIAVVTPVRFSDLYTFTLNTTCGITVTRAVWCWGFSLPDGINQIRYTPVEISIPAPLSILAEYRSYSYSYSEYSHCGVDTQARLWCRSMYYDTAWKLVPGGNASSLFLPGGSSLMCGRDSVGNAQCWFPGGRSVPPISQPAVGSGSNGNNGNGLFGIGSDGRLWNWSSPGTMPPILIVIPP
jgi:hypothetical protein